ncbi:hypothetical protein F4560_005433 [Saccharothrix ecbatanensis]|jgi:hypothetical protein|uniref:DUF1508 domain-containing protein n=1 Tax=Saccharothrix ecbatanensis TaxID=1105145 RepID=A0A7W9HNV5_9PSEU|nr:hypothetical protein [Saccharothrix ecbatanensis]MBB5805665.1 hypothetical protein [Saccharothrix ecbatanensis]
MAAARFQLYRPADSGVTWRFLSANNRSLGQSAIVFPTVEACVHSVDELRERLIDSTTTMSRDAKLWSWRLRLEGCVLAVSSRSYHRRIQAQYACRSFLELVELAPTVGRAPVEQF